MYVVRTAKDNKRMAEQIIKQGRLGVIGAGVMGKTLMKGLLKKEALTQSDIWAAVKSQNSKEQVAQEMGVETVTEYTSLLGNTDVLLICVKPHTVKKVFEELRAANLSKDTLLISIATGVSIEDMESWLGQENPVVRAMPNTPCTVGKGMSVICPGAYAREEHMKAALNIFTAVGKCLELEEQHLNAVTAISGCGPAYFYLIMEALADGGVNVGLPRDVAMQLVTQTAQGAAAMVQDTRVHPAALRDDVTTPAGCTIAALLTMEDGKIRSVLARAVQEATRQAGDLGRTN